MLHQDSISLAFADRPGGPADEPVDGVLRFGLGERKVVPPARELVRSVLKPVGPRNEHLSAPGRRHLGLGVTVEKFAVTGGVGADPAADLHDDNTLIASANLDLLAGRETIPHQAAMRSSSRSPTRRELAMAVRAGLTAPMLGKTLVSTT